MSINYAMDTFFTIIQLEAMYLEEIVTIYTCTLLTVNVLLICIISYYVLSNVRSVFPQCQHCAIGCCLVNSLPLSILHKVHKFYLKSEKRMNIVENEYEARLSLELMGSDDSSSESESSGSSEEDAQDHSAQGQARHHRQASKTSRISFASPHHEQQARRKSSLLLVKDSLHAEPKGTAKGKKHHGSEIQLEDLAIRMVSNDNADQQDLPVVSLTKHNLREYTSDCGSSRHFMSRAETREQSQLWASSTLACSLVPEHAPQQPPVAEEQKDLSSPRIEPEVHGSRTSSACASFYSDLDILVQQGEVIADRGNALVIAAPSNKIGYDVSDSQQSESVLISESEPAGSESDYVSDGEDCCLALRAGEGSQWIPTPTTSDRSMLGGLPPKSSLSEPAKLEIKDSTVNGILSQTLSRGSTSSSVLLCWADWSRRMLGSKRRACIQNPSPAKPRVEFKAGTGISRVAGALRSMLKQTSFNQLMDPHADSRHGYLKPTSYHQDNPDHEQLSFEENIQRAAANQLAWYFRTSVYTVILSMVLIFCFCVWLVPQRIIHQLISTSLLMRFSRFSSVGISKSVFFIREMVLADGFSRIDTAALAGYMEESKSDLLNAITGFRLGQQNGFRIEGADYVQSDVMTLYKNVMYEVLIQSSVMTHA
jgi:hypothetical protein